MKAISPGRKSIYYVGMGLMAVGFLLFISTFVSAALHFGDFSNFEARTGSQFLRAVIGMVLTMIGMVVMVVGARGAAGSGMLLNPKKARDDLEPWARMGGGLLKDAVDESGIKLSGGSNLSFDEKLRRLESLRKDGLITETEFQAKRTEVLSDKI